MSRRYSNFSPIQKLKTFLLSTNFWFDLCCDHIDSFVSDQMSAPKAGDAFPEGVSFMWVPYREEKAGVTACGLPVKYDASKGVSFQRLKTNELRALISIVEFKNKKIVLTAAPGAFSPTCQERHLVSYLEDWPKLKAKGVDNVIFISGNDHWVMSAWGKANGVTDNDSIVSLSN